MELLPFIYLCFIVLMADVLGSFRIVGRYWAFLILFLFTPLIGTFIVLAFPLLPKSICIHDYKTFHAGITYRFKRRFRRGEPYFIIVNDVDVIISAFEFSEYFAVVETRKQYLRKKKLFKNEEINH